MVIHNIYIEVYLFYRFKFSSKPLLTLQGLFLFDSIKKKKKKYEIERVKYMNGNNGTDEEIEKDWQEQNEKIASLFATIRGSKEFDEIIFYFYKDFKQQVYNDNYDENNKKLVSMEEKKVVILLRLVDMIKEVIEEVKKRKKHTCPVEIIRLP